MPNVLTAEADLLVLIADADYWCWLLNGLCDVCVSAACVLCVFECNLCAACLRTACVLYA